MDAAGSLALDHPVLARLREADTWWALRSVLAVGDVNRDAVPPALEALAASDRAVGDDASAAARPAFRDRVLAAMDDGVLAAFDSFATPARRAVPAQLRGPLEQVDAAVRDVLSGGEIGRLRSAERAWADCLGVLDIDTLPTELRLSLLCDASVLHEAVWAATGDPTQLQRLIGALDLVVVGFRAHPEARTASCLDLDARQATVTGRLAAALRNRYDLAGDPADLDQASRMALTAVSIVASDSPDRARWLMEAAVIVSISPRSTSTEALALFAEVRDAEPSGSPLRRRALDFAALLNRSSHDRDSAALDAAIATRTQAWDAPGGRSAATGSALAEALLTRFASQDVLAAAAVLSGESPTVRADPAASPAQCLWGAVAPLLLASSNPVIGVAIAAIGRLHDDPARVDVAEQMSIASGRLNDPGFPPYALDRRIGLLAAARDLDPGSDHDVDRRNDLAVALDERFTARGDERDLHEAIELVRSDTELDPTSAGDVAVANTLAVLLIQRFDLLGNLADLDAAIGVLSSLNGKEPAGLTVADRATVAGNLAEALRVRSLTGTGSSDLDRADAVIAGVLTMVGDGPPAALARARATSAVLCFERWNLSGSLTDLRAAISGWKYALPDLPGPAGATARYNLGNATLVLLQRTPPPIDVAMLDEAIDLLRRAALTIPAFSADRAYAANRLADALSLKAESLTGEPSKAESLTGEPSKAESLKEKVGVDDRLRRRAASWSLRARQFAARCSPEATLRVGWDAGRRAERSQDWAEAADCYGAALDGMLQLVAASAVGIYDDTWLALGYGVPTRAAYALLQCGRTADAVVALEAGRGRLLSEAIGAIDDASVTATQGTALPERAAYRAATVRWRSLLALGGDPDEIDAAHADAVLTRNSMLAASDLSIQVTAPTFDEVTASLTEPLIYVIPGVADGRAIVLTPRHPAQVFVLPGLDEASLGQRVASFRSAATDGTDREWLRTLDRTCEWLGSTLAPLRAALAGPRVTLIPTGALAFLPIHAAWQPAGDGRQVWLDDLVISYAPTATVLAAARSRSAASNGPVSVLAVVDPAPTAEPPLTYARAEAAMATRGAVEVEMLAGTDASTAAVRLRLAGSRYLHVAAHAVATPGFPRESGIILRDDELLKLGDLARHDFTATRLAFLSACETGVPGAGAPDEVLDLGATLFGAGVDAVLSTMWSVLDASTLLLATRFYEIFQAGDDDPAHALAEAQRWVRGTSNGEMLTHWVTEHSAGRLPTVTFTAVNEILAALSPESCDFAGADHWAAFRVVGF